MMQIEFLLATPTVTDTSTEESKCDGSCIHGLYVDIYAYIYK